MTHKQWLFIQAYIVSGNATQAAIEAGYSAHTAQVQGSRLLRQTAVKAQIQQQQDLAARAANSDLQKLIQELEKVRMSAHFEGNLVAATRAIMCKAKLLGLIAPVKPLDEKQKDSDKC